MENKKSNIEELQSFVRTVDNNQDPGLNSETLIKRDKDDVITKTELTDTQIKAVTKLRVLAEMTGNHLIDEMVNTFMNAQVSRERASRMEFIQNNQSLRTHEEMKAAGSNSPFGWMADKV